MANFTHLHVHTEYSLLDGVNRTKSLFEKVKNLGMNSVAISDHGMMYGVPEFWKYSKDFELKPILGCEMYVAPTTRDLRKDVEGVKYYHLLLLAKNLQGYKNLIKLVSIGNLEGMYYKPRVDRETLVKYSEGIICTSACMAGPISKNLLRGRKDTAIDWLKFLKDTYKENFYIELQRHGFDGNDSMNSLEKENLNSILLKEENTEEAIDNKVEQKYTNLILREFAEEYKIPLVATTDAHYLNEKDREVQSVLFCIKDGKLLTDDDCRTGYEGTYILSPEQMEAKFADIPQAIENTFVLSEGVENYNIGFDRVQPHYWNMPKDKTAEELLVYETYTGAIRKYNKDIVDHTNLKPEELKKLLSPELVERIDYELKVIHDKGYDDYFLVVSDLMKWAASQDILMGVRGSVAGSVVAHCLEIVEVEPIKWELYFERFLNPERPSPPDIDMDIQDDRRDEVINYVKEKYGDECVAAICSLGRLKTKAAIRDVCRVMNIDLKTADTLSKMVTVLFGKPFKFSKMMDTDKEFANIVNSKAELLKMGEVVKKVEEMSRHFSVHACGHLITPTPITDYVPLQLESGADQRTVTQYEFSWLEDLGLMKFDFLGLRTLTIINNAIHYIKKNKGIDIDYYSIPEHDKETFALFSRGETIGVFQFESPPMQKYLIELQPETQEDLCFLVAAYRPGPMQYISDYIKRKHGEQDVVLVTPDIEKIVGGTYGFAIYQEQVIRIAVELAGYTMGSADILRRAMGKKKMDVMQKEEVKFKDGVKEKGMSQEVADQLWNYLLPFADYGFNKAHAAGYAVLAYKTAYLKAHYPLEFMTAVMHSDLGRSDRNAVNLREARRMGFNILSPNINKSDLYFEPEDGTNIRFGMGAIKNVGTEVCLKIVRERVENGTYRNFDEFVKRMGTKNMNKRTIESLIMAGALDEFGDRNALLKIVSEVVEKASRKESMTDSGMQDLFSMLSQEDQQANEGSEITPFPVFDSTTDVQKIEWEKDLLGIYVSTHPLEKYEWTLLQRGIGLISNLESNSVDSKVRVLGIFSEIRKLKTKAKNESMAAVTIEDLTGICDGVIFPKKYIELNEAGLIDTNKAYVITGRINERDEKKSIIIETIELAEGMRPPNKIKLDLRFVNDRDKIQGLKDCFADDGIVDVEIRYGDPRTPKTMVKKLRNDISDYIEILKEYME